MYVLRHWRIEVINAWGKDVVPMFLQETDRGASKGYDGTSPKSNA